LRVNPQDAPSPKLAVVEVLYTAPSRTGHTSIGKCTQPTKGSPLISRIRGDEPLAGWQYLFGALCAPMRSVKGGFMCRMSVAAMVLIASTVSVDVGAQSISVHRVEISSNAARKMVEACVAYAERNKLLVGAAVVGIDGVLIDFHLMQGATATNSETAILKAKTAAHWQRPTRELEEWVKTGSNGAPAWIGDFPRAGGVPIVIDGMVAGAIGVGGGGDGGDDCAQYAIDTVIRKRP
jgi:glc operon protein GlcG